MLAITCISNHCHTCCNSELAVRVIIYVNHGIKGIFYTRCVLILCIQSSSSSTADRHTAPSAVNMDRLTPRCSQDTTPSSHTPSPATPTSPNMQTVFDRAIRRSPSQRKARDIVRKYRRKVREAEFKRLEESVPAVSKQRSASKVKEMKLEDVYWFFTFEQKGQQMLGAPLFGPRTGSILALGNLQFNLRNGLKLQVKEPLDGYSRATNASPFRENEFCAKFWVEKMGLLLATVKT